MAVVVSSGVVRYEIGEWQMAVTNIICTLKYAGTPEGRVA
jgi:hypothetical protein